MKNNVFVVAFCIALTACGGGGSSGSSNGGPSSSPDKISSSSSSSSQTITTSSATSLFSSNQSSNSSNSFVQSSANQSSIAASSTSANSSASVSSLSSKIQYLPAAANEFTREDILLINTANPNNPIQIETSVANSYVTIPRADFDLSKGISNVKPAYVVYAKEGRLFKVDLSPDSGAPAPTVISNETQVAATCPYMGVESTQFLETYVDYIPESSIILYRARLGNSCVSKAAWVGMGSNSNPIDLAGKEILSPYLSPATGRLAGFLIREGSQLLLTDEKFSNVVLLSNIITGIQVITSSTKGSLLLIDGALRRFDFSSKSLSNPLLNYADPAQLGLTGSSDNSHFYLVGPELTNTGLTTGQQAIYRINDAAQTAEVTSLYATNVNGLQLLDLTQDKLIIRTANGVQALNKRTGAATNLTVPANAAVIGSNNNRIFYWSINVANVAKSVFGSVLDTNESAVTLDNAGLVAVVDSGMGLNVDADIDMFMILGYGENSTSMANGDLRIVDASNGAKAQSIGTLPNLHYDSSYFNSFRFGTLTLCNQASAKCDAFYHTTDAGSLVKITQHVTATP